MHTTKQYRHAPPSHAMGFFLSFSNTVFEQFRLAVPLGYTYSNLTLACLYAYNVKTKCSWREIHIMPEPIYIIPYHCVWKISEKKTCLNVKVHITAVPHRGVNGPVFLNCILVTEQSSNLDSGERTPSEENAHNKSRNRNAPFLFLDSLFFRTEKQRVICKNATKTNYLTLSSKQFLKKSHRKCDTLKSMCMSDCRGIRFLVLSTDEDHFQWVHLRVSTANNVIILVILAVKKGRCTSAKKSAEKGNEAPRNKKFLSIPRTFTARNGVIAIRGKRKACNFFWFQQEGVFFKTFFGPKSDGVLSLGRDWWRRKIILREEGGSSFATFDSLNECRFAHSSHWDSSSLRT